MNEKSKCNECGTDLAGDAAEGLCPKCLMQQAMAMLGGSKSPDFYSGVIALSGTLQDDALATIKITPASNKIPFYIIHGTADQVMPFELAKNAEKYLKSKNYPVTLISFEGGHTLPRNYVDIFKQAINSFSAQKQKAGK